MYRFRFQTLLVAALLVIAVPAAALDARAYIDKAATLIEAGDYALARSYLGPALISPRLHSTERSRAYYLRGYSFYVQAFYVSAGKDYARALEFNPDNPATLYAMGGLHYYGRGMAQDRPLAFQLFEKAASFGHAGGLFYVGYAYLDGEGVDKDLLEARRWLQKAADEGHLPAMVQMAASFRDSHTDAPDPDQAKTWYEQARDAGATDALVALGYMYQNGEFGEPMPEAAIDYFSEAAASGSGPGMASLAHAYLTGTGVEQDYGAAHDWFLKAAELQTPGSYIGIGHLYQVGRGVPLDLAKARDWYTKGAQLGLTRPLLRLVYLLFEEDEQSAAATWVQKAASNGDVQPLNDYAWLLATSRTDGLRDGEVALQHAHRAVELDRNASYLDTLAAAYAELGQFDDAISVQQQALAMAEDDAELFSELNKHLLAYQRAEPWRE